MGNVLTASLRPYSGQGRRLSSGVKNEIVIDFDTAGSTDVPTKTQIRDAAFEVCNMLEAKECAQHVSFKSDTTGASVEWFSEPEPANPSKSRSAFFAQMASLRLLSSLDLRSSSTLSQGRGCCWGVRKTHRLWPHPIRRLSPIAPKRRWTPWTTTRRQRRPTAPIQVNWTTWMVTPLQRSRKFVIRFSS